MSCDTDSKLRWDLLFWSFNRFASVRLRRNGIAVRWVKDGNWTRALLRSIDLFGSKPMWTLWIEAYLKSSIFFCVFDLLVQKASNSWFEGFDMLVPSTWMLQFAGWNGSISWLAMKFWWWGSNSWFELLLVYFEMTSIYLMEALGNDEPLKTKLIENQTEAMKLASISCAWNRCYGWYDSAFCQLQFLIYKSTITLAFGKLGDFDL